MLPIVEIPESILSGLEEYREIFCRREGFEQVGRYITGLITSPNKTLQGIHDMQYWGEGKKVSSRAMHEAVFEAGWQSEKLMSRHRQLVSHKYRGRGRQVIALDWTLSHHPRGRQLFGIKRGYDYVNGNYSWYQTVLTASIANQERVDGLEVWVQRPEQLKKEQDYLKSTAKASYESLEAARERLIELLYYTLHRKRYQKITEMATEVARQLEEEGYFPTANYTFDNGVLNLELTRVIEERGKEWVSELETSRTINWKGKWRKIGEVAEELKAQHPEAFRRIEYWDRSGKLKVAWAFTKSVRLKRYGKKRIVIVYEKSDLSDKPRFLITSALHWEARRVLTHWSYRWSCELFHEFSKQGTGFEKAQVRKEEAVKRHFRLSCVAQTLLQNLTLPASTSAKFKFAQGQITQGQRQRKIFREVLLGILTFARQAFLSGKNQFEVLEQLIPT